MRLEPDKLTDRRNETKQTKKPSPAYVGEPALPVLSLLCLLQRELVVDGAHELKPKGELAVRLHLVPCEKQRVEQSAFANAKCKS